MRRTPAPTRVVAADLVPVALERARTKVGQDPRLDTVVCDLEGSPRLALERWIAGDLADPRALAERVPGVHHGSLERLLETRDDGVFAALRGREPDLGALCRRLRLPGNAEDLLYDLNLLTRCLVGRVQEEDARSGLRLLPETVLDPSGLPFACESFDRVTLSLVLSYIQHPEDLLFEVHRVLRPGGVMVLSSMRVDSDTSRIYLDLIARLERGEEDSRSEEHSQKELLRAARSFAAHASTLYRREEEGLFRFYDDAGLVDMVSRRGFVEPRVDREFGSPPQAVVVRCCKA